VIAAFADGKIVPTAATVGRLPTVVVDLLRDCVEVVSVGR
jgi:hypothetical protein